MRRIIAILAAAGAVTTLSGCETVAEATQPTFHADLTGATEVPGPGDPDGRGSAELHIADPLDRICYEINVQNLVEVTVAHIHRGAAGVAGPPVVTLQAPTDGHSEDCEDIDGSLADEIEANPAGFYINVHTREHPDGAVRGQLRH
jgi:hypothetical protein